MPLGGLRIRVIRVSKCLQRSSYQHHILKNEQSYSTQQEQVMCWITVLLLTTTATLPISLSPIDGVMESHLSIPTMAALVLESFQKVVASHYKIAGQIFL